MSEQMTDSFIWEGKKWIFLGADNIYSLFDPQKFGLSPTPPHTACWKGFIVQFRTFENQLILDQLHVHCDNRIYPKINGIKPRFGGFQMKAYNNLNMKLSYTGTIIVGKGMLPEFRGRAFTGPHSYATTYELTFREGTLVNSRETSGSYSGF